MKLFGKHIIANTSCLALVAAALTLSANSSRAADSEDKLLADLDSPKEATVVDGFLGIERHYPTSTRVVPYIKKDLTDPRPKVRRKAAREAGIFRVALSPDEIKEVCALLKSSDTPEVLDGLKALRDLKDSTAVPAVEECLHSSVANVKRDACRTLAVIGGKNEIAAIQPLLSDPEPKVQADAERAITDLKEK